MSSHSFVEVHLDRLQRNFETLRRLYPNVTLAPVLKSDAYGHGAVECALRLEAAGVQRICVYSVDKALQLRRGGL